jgi:hypothetical protein
MQTQTQILDPLSCKNWDERLKHHEKASFFHGQAWARVLLETYRYQPLYFCTANADSIVNLLGVMEVKSFLTGKRGVSLPFTDYCEPILEDGTKIEFLMEEVRRYGKQHHWKWFQVRGGDITDAATDQQYWVHELKLEKDTDTLFAKLSPSKRRNIRKAQSQAVQILHRNDRAALDAYYRLHCRTRKRQGVPPQPYRFFNKIFEHVISKGQGQVLLALHQQEIIAGSIFFHFKDKALYKFGASDMSFQHLRANDLVMWEAIRWYAANAYHHFCFGRTEMENTGLRRFKLDWGAQERILNYYRYDMRQENFVTTQTAVKPVHKRIFQMLPIPALKAFGSMTYRHMG